MRRTSPDASPKIGQILRGAKEAFVELGYEGASVDEIARRAGVSKGTLYSHFADKRRIFTAFVQQEIEAQAQRIVQGVASAGPAEASLRHIARDYVEFIVSPFALDMFRLIVAESQRFPEIGRTFYDSGPDLAIRRLSQFLAAADARGELRIEDPELAAHQFVMLCRADLFYKRLLGVKASVTLQEIQRVAETAVATFLKAYRR